MAADTVPEKLRTKKNEQVLTYLEPQDCHSDILEPLENALRRFSDVQGFCPNTWRYRYVFYHVKETVFAFAAGMRFVTLRLPEDHHEEAMAQGAFNCKEAGDDWYSFLWDMEQMDRWSGIAYEYANNS